MEEEIVSELDAETDEVEMLWELLREFEMEFVLDAACVVDWDEEREFVGDWEEESECVDDEDSVPECDEETELDEDFDDVIEFDKEAEMVEEIEPVSENVCDFTLEMEWVRDVEFGNPMMKRQMCGSACEQSNVVSVLFVG